MPERRSVIPVVVSFLMRAKERDRQREKERRETDRQTDRQTETESGGQKEVRGGGGGGGGASDLVEVINARGF